MGGNPFDTPFGHRIETTLLALCSLMTSVVPLLEASKLLIRCHGDSGEKTHILMRFWGAIMLLLFSSRTTCGKQ